MSLILGCDTVVENDLNRVYNLEIFKSSLESN